MPRKAAKALKAIPTARTRIKRSCTTCSRTATLVSHRRSHAHGRKRHGFFYFVDRIGDTFRWKGENVATSEVAAAIMAFSGITEANVYGVRVPGNEGAAGMAAIVPDGWLDVAALRAHLAQRLPAYARPKFLRVAKELATTSTFKHTKNDLQRDGFDPAATSDTILFRRSGERRFRAARPGAVRADQSRRGAVLSLLRAAATAPRFAAKLA